MKSFLKILLFLLLNIQLISQECISPDASIWKNTWVSCEKSINPISSYGNSHWIQYDLGSVRRLSKTWIWNTNDPDHLDQGFKTVKIDYSIDGTEWTHWGEMQFPKAAGNAIYSGFSGPDLVDIEAQFVLLTAIDNHGDPSCAGLAEMKFNLLPQFKAVEGQVEDDCTELKDLVVEAIGPSNTFIFWEWESDEALFDFEIRIAGTEEWFYLELEESEIFLEDLEPNTTYEFIIGFDCEDDYYDSGIQSFTTAVCPSINEAPNVRVYPTGASLEWTQAEGVTFYLISWEEEGSNDPEIVDVEGNTFEIEDLELNENYLVRIGVLCGEEIIWSPAVTFTTGSENTTSVNSELNVQQELVQLYPNPTSSRFTFTYRSSIQDEIHYAILDINGKIVHQNINTIAPGLNIIEVDLSTLPGGVYILETTTLQKRTRSALKLVKSE